MSIVQKRIQDYSYDINKIIGSGFSSKVFLGKHLTSGQKVAIKVIQLSKVSGQVQRLLLRNEIKAVGLVKHLNVVDCRKVLQTQNNMYLVTQFCEGGDLQKIIKKQKIQQDYAIRLFQKVVRGYCAISKAGVIHRDIKSSNIFMKNGQPKIGDFGFCDIIGGEKASRFYNVGSPAYMSPQAYFDTKYSFKSDIWALGSLLHQMVVGRSLLQGDYSQAISKLQQKGLSYIKGKVGGNIYQILSVCLKIKPQQRPEPQQLLHLVQKINNNKQFKTLSTQVSTTNIIQTLVLNNSSNNFFPAKPLQNINKIYPISPRKQQDLKLIQRSNNLFYNNNIQKGIIQVKMQRPPSLAKSTKPKQILKIKPNLGNQQQINIKQQTPKKLQQINIQPLVNISIPIVQKKMQKIQPIKLNINFFQKQIQIVKGQLQFCNILNQQLQNAIQLAGLQSPKIFKNGTMYLLYLKLINLKTNQLKLFFQGNNIYNIVNYNQFSKSNQFNQLHKNIQNFRTKYQKKLNMRSLNYITDNDIFNYFILTADQFKSKSIIQVGKNMTSKAVQQIFNWPNKSITLQKGLKGAIKIWLILDIFKKAPLQNFAKDLQPCKKLEDLNYQSLVQMCNKIPGIKCS